MVHATDTESGESLSYYRYVRKLQYIPEDDLRYVAGCNIENRIEPPAVEIPGDPLDRQRCIADFDQNLVGEQDCLVLGAGGIGQNVGLTLARCGVNSITFVDNDVYEVSNLSRQLLGSHRDIGKRKVDVAVESILNFHNITPTAAHGHHLDALFSWGQIVSSARCSSVIFNCIDVGTVFDFAVNSLSKALSIPLVQGQSAGWSVNAEFYTGKPGLMCGACSTSIASSFALEGVPFRAIQDRLTKWIQANHNSGVFSSEINSSADIESDSPNITVEMLLLFLNQDKQYRVNGPTALQIVSEAVKAVSNLKATKVAATPDACTSNGGNCIAFQDFQLFLKQYHEYSLQLLLPDHICSLTDILFIPRPKGIPTRYIGSWVCPCLTVSAIMVSQWVNYLTGPTERDPPSSFQLSLSSCRTDICDMALECGFVEPPSQSSDPSSSTCKTCAKTASRVEAQLFYSLIPLNLNPHPGHTLEWSNGDDTTKHVDSFDQENAGTRAADSKRSMPKPLLERRRGSLWYDIDHLGPEYVSLALDAVPCFSLERDGAFKEVSQVAGGVTGGGGNSDWPLVLRIPLVKGMGCTRGGMQEGGSLSAYGSGQRSALLFDPNSDLVGGTCYRLKGCGMPGVGFTVEDALDDNGQRIQIPSAHTLESCKSAEVGLDMTEQGLTPLRKIRGAAYPHTCTIELEMTAAIDFLLRNVGMMCANRPIGRWDYTLDPAIAPVPAPPSVQSEHRYPLVTRSCALFETFGDRRLSDHVLRGLELLLPLVTCPDPSTQPDEDTLSSNTTYAALTALKCARDLHTDVSTVFDVEACDEYDERLTPSVLLYNGGAKTPPSLFADLTLPTGGLKGVRAPESSQFPPGIPKNLKCVWDQCCATLAEPITPCGGADSGDPCLLGYLYWRFGRECGTVGKVLRNNCIVWGAYTDATGRHMNAHGNNFALLNEQTGGGDSFLAPLDLDMSYTRENCCFGLDTREEELAMFDELSESEFSELGFNLSMCQSTRSSTTSGTLPPCALPKHLGVVRMALRDTLVKGWLSAVQGGEDSCPPVPALKPRAYATLKLALILTWDVVA